MNAEVEAPTVVAEVERRLAAAGVPSPRADARWLVEHVLRVAGAVTGCGAALLDGLVARRLAREPLQLVLGTTSFRTVELACRPGVFLPRPETEVVAGLAVDAARRAGRAPVIVEPCTGGGAIAASLLAEVPGATIVATDLDDAAVALARENLERVRTGDAGGRPAAAGASATVLRGDLLGPVDPALCGHLDVLVSNPPYLPARDRGSFEVEVAAHDPDRALIGGPDGHEVVDRLLASAGQWLAPGGTVVVEIDERRADDAVRVARAVGLVDVRVAQDLAGRDRALVAGRASDRAR